MEFDDSRSKGSSTKHSEVSGSEKGSKKNETAKKGKNGGEVADKELKRERALRKVLKEAL